MSDYTAAARLCDDHGIVSGNYLALLNVYRAATQPLGEWGEYKPVEDPFPCTGSAHLAGEHIRCVNPVHHNYGGMRVEFDPAWPKGIIGLRP